jgi:hypothetical protein
MTLATGLVFVLLLIVVALVLSLPGTWRSFRRGNAEDPLRRQMEEEQKEQKDQTRKVA